MSDDLILCGTASVEITPPAGLALVGFAARESQAEGMHDPLSARALVVGDTALLTLDVLGVTSELSREICALAGFDPNRVIVHATHTHGGPATMENRLFSTPNAAYLQELKAKAAAALIQAREGAEPARLRLSTIQNSAIGKNRRHQDGPTDATLSLLRVETPSGKPLALLCNYACHPVVLGADNLQWTADYPHYLRTALEADEEGALGLFATGFAGDVNTGHSAAASITRSAQKDRTFERAREIGQSLASAALSAPPQQLSTHVAAAAGMVTAEYAPLGGELDLAALIQSWHADYPTADPVRRSLLEIWLHWAAQAAPQRGQIDLPLRVLNWGGLLLIGLPGEIFSRTALDLRSDLQGHPLMPIGFATDNPGYIPPVEEYAFGGYEVEEAHRFYNLPASFASGTAEALAAEALRLARICLGPRA